LYGEHQGCYHHQWTSANNKGVLGLHGPDITNRDRKNIIGTKL